MAYARRTKVPVVQSRSAVEAKLRAHGATGFGYAEDRGREVVFFRIADRHVRIEVGKAEDEQKHRQRWRAILLIVTAKLEAIESGISTIEREFLADIVMPDGRTVASWLTPQLASAYETGKMPSLLPGVGETGR